MNWELHEPGLLFMKWVPSREASHILAQMGIVASLLPLPTSALQPMTKIFSHV